MWVGIRVWVTVCVGKGVEAGGGGVTVAAGVAEAGKVAEISSVERAGEGVKLRTTTARTCSTEGVAVGEGREERASVSFPRRGRRKKTPRAIKAPSVKIPARISPRRIRGR